MAQATMLLLSHESGLNICRYLNILKPILQYCTLVRIALLKAATKVAARLSWVVNFLSASNSAIPTRANHRLPLTPANYSRLYN